MHTSRGSSQDVFFVLWSIKYLLPLLSKASSHPAGRGPKSNEQNKINLNVSYLKVFFTYLQDWQSLSPLVSFGEEPLTELNSFVIDLELVPPRLFVQLLDYNKMVFHYGQSKSSNLVVLFYLLLLLSSIQKELLFFSKMLVSRKQLRGKKNYAIIW